MRGRPLRLLLVGLLAAGSGHAAAPSLTEASLPVTEGAGPRLSVGPGGTTLSWLVGGDESSSLMRSRWTDGAWSQPQRVASIPRVVASWADPPTVIAGAGHEVATWLVAAGEGHGVHLMVSASQGGGPWSPPVRVHDDVSQTEHGFATLFAEADGSTRIAWLDGRGFREGGAQQTTLLQRRLSVDGALGPEAVLDERTCDCCPTAGAVLADGTPFLAWRDRIGGEVRDMSAGGLDGAPVRVHEDGWEFAGCPVNGPGVAAFGGGGAAVVWLTEAKGPEVRVAIGGAAGFSAATTVASGEAVLGRTAAVALDAERVLVTWVEGTKDTATLRGAVITKHGAGAMIELGAVPRSRSAGFPSLALLDDRVLVVFADGRVVRGREIPMGALGR